MSLFYKISLTFVKSEKRRLRIPPKLAYGENAAGKIPANSQLIFETELIDIE